MSAKVAAKGHAHKHVKTSKAKKATSKHHPAHHKKAATAGHAGHHVTAKGTHAHHAKAVGFAVGDLLPVCSFEAVAMSLRLAGQPVHGDEVAALWELCGAAGATTIGDALAAAARFGLAGYRPVQQGYVGPVDTEALRGKVRVASSECGIDLRECLVESVPDLSAHGLILGVDRPGPHAVLATADGWWSWGELYDPWTCRVDSAWAVSWS